MQEYHHLFSRGSCHFFNDEDMALIFLFLRRVFILVLGLIQRPVVTSLDIVLTDTLPERSKSEGCKEKFDNQSSISRLTWELSLWDQFAAAKTIKSLDGHKSLRSPHPSCRLKCTRRNARSYNGSCSLDCSKLFSKQTPVFTSGIHKPARASRQQIFNDLISGEHYRDRILRGIQLILSHENWRNYILVTSNNEDLKAISSGTRPSSSQLLFTVTEHLNNSLANTYRGLQEVDLNFIVVCSSICILQILHQAYMLEGATVKRSRWLVVPIGEDVGDFQLKQTQIKTTDVVFLEFLRCSDRYPPLASTSYNALPVANVYIVHDMAIDTTMYKGGYIGETGLVLTKELYPGMKYGFNQKTLIVALLPWPPFVMKKVDNGSVFYSGISMDLLNELALVLNFSYKLVEPEDQEWGRVLDGQWTGMVKLIAEKKADLILGPIAIEHSREEVMDFSSPYFYVESAVLLRETDARVYKWMTLIVPFRIEVHVCIFLSLIFSTVFLFIVEEVHPANTITNNTLSDKRKRIGNILWNHFGALMANGGTYLPKTQAGRSVLACWWLFSVISAAIYSGNLIAFLTDWREKPQFSTLAELVEQDNYKWGTVGGSAFVTLFQTSNRSDYRKIWHGLESSMNEDPDVLNRDSEVHLRKVLAGQYAYISDTVLLETWQTEHCDLHMLQEEFFLMAYALGLPNKSVDKQIFSNKISRIYESGIIDVWYKKWMPKSQCETTKSSKRVDLLMLQSAFYASGIGVLLASLMLVTELFLKRKREGH